MAMVPDYNDLKFDHIADLHTWVQKTQSDLDKAIETLNNNGSFDVGSMLDAQVKMNSFSQAVEFNSNLLSALNSAAMTVARNSK